MTNRKPDKNPRLQGKGALNPNTQHSQVLQSDKISLLPAYAVQAFNRLYSPSPKWGCVKVERMDVPITM